MDVEELRILLTTQASTRGANQTRDALRQVRTAATDTQGAIRGSAGAIDVSTASALKFGGSLIGVASAFTLVHSAVQAATAALGAAIQIGVEFGTAMAGVGAVSGASASQLDRLSELARTSGRDLGIGAVQGAKGLQELIKGGVSTEAALGGALRATEVLAKAGGVDLATAAEISATALNAFGLSAGQLAHVADLVAGAANASSIGVDDFRQSLSQAGAVARTIGVTFDDTAVAIAELGQAGIKGSDAGTSLRTFLISLSGTSVQATDELKRLGIITAEGANQFFDASGKAKSLADVSQILKTALTGYTDQQKLASLQTIFGTDALRAASIFTREGAAGFDKLAAAMAGIKAADVAKAQVNSLGGDMDKLAAAVAAAAVSLEKTFDPQLRSTAAEATKTAQGIDALFQALDRGLPAPAKPIAAPTPPPAAGLPPRPTAPLVFEPKPLPTPATSATFTLATALPPLVVTATAAVVDLGRAFSGVDETVQRTHRDLLQVAKDIGELQGRSSTLATILGALSENDTGTRAQIAALQDLQKIDAQINAQRAAAALEQERAREREATKISDPRDAVGARAAQQRLDILDQLVPLEQAVAEAQRQQAEISAAVAQNQGKEAALLLAILPQHQEIARLERSKADAIDRSLQLRQQETTLLAQQAALGPANALDDTQAAIQRNQLIIADRRGQSPEDRRAARLENRDLSRNVLPGQAIEGFDAARRVALAQRAEGATGLSGSIATNRIDQQIFAIGRSIKGTEDLVFALNQNTEAQQMMGQFVAAMSAAAEKKVQVVVSGGLGVNTGGGTATAREVTDQILAQLNDQIFGQLTEALDQAPTPPTIPQSGVRR